MSQPSPFGPFPDATPKPLAAGAATAAAGPVQMEYLRSVQYIFDNPNWLMNLVWSFLCSLAGQVIPIVPGMVLMGYQFEMLEDLHANRGTRYPDFDINRLVEYLSRGVWPMLVMLIVIMLSAFAIMMLVFGTAFCAGAVGSSMGDDAGGVLALVGILGGLVIGMALGGLASVFITPMVLKAGLQQDLGAAFDFGFVRDFAGKMWVETILSSLFLMFSALALILVTCFVAAIVIGPMLPFVSTHLYYQLYSIYLSRGGTPIPLKPRMALPQPGYVAPRQY